MKHVCHAENCSVVIPPEMLMCKRHWGMVPMEIRREVWATYRPGQCDDKNPSAAWLRAADAAIKSVRNPLIARSVGRARGR